MKPFALLLMLALPFSATGQDQSMVSYLDGDPKWEGFRNRLLPVELPQIVQDFAWSRSQHAGGLEPGEIGGRIQRSLKRCRYSMALPTPRTLEDTIEARGKLAVTQDEGSSGALIGFFHQSSDGWRTPSSIALRIDGNGDKYWLFFEYGTINGKTGGKGVFEGERYQTTKTEPFAADGTTHDWHLLYDPDAGESGTLSFTVDGHLHALEITDDARHDGATFDRFGIWNQQTTGNGMEVWLDDIVVNGESFAFEDDPDWIAENNSGTFSPSAIRPFHDFGYQAAKKSIGGIIWRDEAPCYYAAPVANLTLHNRLHASGRIRLIQAAADSGVYIGWFHSKKKKENTHPEHERRQCNYLAVHIEGPSRVGHYFRPGYGTETGKGRNAEHGPILRPDAKWHTWSIEYRPETARIVATLDNQEATLDLEGIDRSNILCTFDRFGIFNHQSGGWHMLFELNALRFTGR